MKHTYDRLNESLRGKTLVDTLVLYRNWTYTHEWWFPLAILILSMTILISVVIGGDIWPWIAGPGTALFLFMMGPVMLMELLLDENDRPAEIASKILTWSNVIVVSMTLLFIDIFVAVAHNPPQIGHALFNAVLFLAGVFLLWFEHRQKSK